MNSILEKEPVKRAEKSIKQFDQNLEVICLEKTARTAEDAATADAWATALYVLGKEQGLKLANENGLAVIFIDEDGESIQSSSWSMIQL